MKGITLMPFLIAKAQAAKIFAASVSMGRLFGK
jgi:hypothetical protein